MALLEDMKTLIAAIETNIKIGEMPDVPDNAIALFRSGGADPTHSFESRLFSNPTFQVRVRNISYAMAETKAQQVALALDGLTEQTINGTRYISIMQQSDLLPIGKDSKGRSEFTLNFQARVEHG